MRPLTLLLFLHHTLAQFFNQEICTIDYRSFEDMWENKLLHDLVNCTDIFEPPAQNGSKPLSVHLQFFMKLFKFDSELQEFSTKMTMIIVWQDDRLKWNPKKYEDLDKLILPTRNRIWTPGVRLINTIGDEYDERYLYIPCEIESSGILDCVAEAVFKVKCNVDLQDWPYDKQYCKLEFGAYSEINTKVQFDIGLRAMVIETTENETDWKITKYEQILDETSEKQVILKFRLERHTIGLAAIVIYPSLALFVLSFSSLFIDARLDHRLVVVCVSLMCHFYFLTGVSWVFPENTKDSPSLLLFYRGSLILTSIIVVLSFMLNVICKKGDVCPDWIISINDFVYLKGVKHFVLPRWETKIVTASNNSSSRNSKDWTDFANIVNTASILVSVIVYISLYIAYMPRANSFD